MRTAVAVVGRMMDGALSSRMKPPPSRRQEFPQEMHRRLKRAVGLKQRLTGQAAQSGNTASRRSGRQYAIILASRNKFRRG